MNFTEFGLNEKIIESIGYMGFSSPTPIQEQAIPKILQGEDLIACAQTGTGKTAAFLLPVIHKIMENGDEDNIQALIVVPTRELAVQISTQLDGMGYLTGINGLAVYGGGDGTSFDTEKKALTTGAPIIIATPGRLIAHLKQGYVNMKNLQFLILDEADRMLDMGFYDDIVTIEKAIKTKKQTLMFSATMPRKIRDLAKKTLVSPSEIDIAISTPAEGIDQKVSYLNENQKLPFLKHILKQKPYETIIIFSSTKRKVNEIFKEVRKFEQSVESVSSDLGQQEREKALNDFRNKKLKIIIATDVLSRGIDVEGIDLVLNYDVPPDPEDYVHRIGRTARASTEGEAITFANTDDFKKLSRIEGLIKKPVPELKVPEEFGETPTYHPDLFFNKKKNSKYKKRKHGNFKGKKRFNSGNNGKND